MNYNPPGALTSKAWRLFRREFKEKAPVRYWIQNDLRYSIVMPVIWKIQNVRHWFAYRTYNRFHVVKTGLPPGYYEPEVQLLHSSFNILKDFVEVELAWHSYMWSDERKSATVAEKYVPFYRAFKPFRSREWGLKHLEWASTLDDPILPLHERCDHQARDAREIRELYLWWTDHRPARKEVELPKFDDQGLGFLGILDDDFDSDASDYKEFGSATQQNNELHKLWDEEDTDMLIRLMKIRKSLWT